MIKSIDLIRVDDGYRLNIYTQNDLIMAGYRGNGKLLSIVGNLADENIKDLVPRQIFFIDRTGKQES